MKSKHTKSSNNNLALRILYWVLVCVVMVAVGIFCNYLYSQYGVPTYEYLNRAAVSSEYVAPKLNNFMDFYVVMLHIGCYVCGNSDLAILFTQIVFIDLVLLVIFIIIRLLIHFIVSAVRKHKKKTTFDLPSGGGQEGEVVTVSINGSDVEVHLLDNPLPVPKKKERRVVGFDNDSDEFDDYELVVSDDDDFDIK